MGAHAQSPNRPVGPQDQEACRVTPTPDMLTTPEWPITPVEIFQDEHEQTVGSEHLQRLGELPKHAGRRDHTAVRRGAHAPWPAAAAGAPASSGHTAARRQ